MASIEYLSELLVLFTTGNHIVCLSQGFSINNNSGRQCRLKSANNHMHHQSSVIIDDIRKEGVGVKPMMI